MLETRNMQCTVRVKKKVSKILKNKISYNIFYFFFTMNLINFKLK